MIKRLRNRSAAITKKMVHHASIRFAYQTRRKDSLQPIFIVSEPRTGSTYLQDLLNSIPGVSMTGEVLSPVLPIGIRRSFVSQVSVMRHIRYSLCALPDTICGAKFLIDQLNLHGLGLNDLRDHFPSAKYLILYRDSLLEQFVSWKVAKATGQWVGAKSGQSKFAGKLWIDPAELRSYCERERHKYVTLLRHLWLRDQALLIAYENVAKDPQTVFENGIFPLLGIAPTQVATTMSKQITRDMSELIENYSELEPNLDEYRLHVEWRDETRRQRAEACDSKPACWKH